MKQNKTLRNVIRSALFLALAYVLPFLTAGIPEFGSMLCPMHLPVLLCGFLCGWPWGLAVGAIAPLFRSLTLGMPVLFPKAVCMALELAAYGAAAGIFYKLLPRRRISTYVALLIAMVAGRLVYGAAMLVCLGIQGKGYALSAFLASTVTGAIPGIVLQILLIPIIVELYARREKD
ncbi:MAG: ECF transporter S component [Clostridia bacterium]|nr:ECF transporter S component [Clostridia bacterium]